MAEMGKPLQEKHADSPLGEVLGDSVGNIRDVRKRVHTGPPRYNIPKIRRRCEEMLRTINDDELILNIAKQLKVKLF